MPTLLDLCDVSHSLEFHGQSLLPLLRDPSMTDDERIIVTDSQRVPDPVKWKQSSVMMGKWRLINGSELYDIRDDRAQKNDISRYHPETVKALRKGYEKWWELVKPDFDKEIPIEIGGRERAVRLSSHDWRNDDGELVWNQKQIRQGVKLNGYWEVDILRTGLYEIELCRWPLEGCGRTVRAGMETDDIQWVRDAVDPEAYDFYRGGAALDIREAEFSLGNIRERKAAEERVLFSGCTAEGPHHLRTAFYTEEGCELGAYYCYVRKID